MVSFLKRQKTKQKRVDNIECKQSWG